MDLRSALKALRESKYDSVKHFFVDDCQLKVKRATSSDDTEKQLKFGDIKFCDLSGDIKYVISGEIIPGEPFNKSTVYVYKKDSDEPEYIHKILKNYSIEDVGQLASKIIKKWDLVSKKGSLVE